MKQICSIVLTAAVVCMLAVSPITAQQAASYTVEYQAAQRYRDFRFVVGGGYAFALGKIVSSGDSRIDDFNKQFRHGFNVDADAQYFFKESWGLGLNVNYCSSTATGNDIGIPDSGYAFDRIKESRNILFVGPSFAARSESGKFMLLSSFAMGPLFFMDRMDFDGVRLNDSQTAFGFNAGIAGEYKLNDKTGAGLKLSYTLGSVSSINIEGQNVQSKEQVSISNLMLTAFISFRTW